MIASLLAFLFYLLLAVVLTDWRQMRIPDVLTAMIALLSLPYLYCSGQNPWLALEGAVLAGTIAWALRRYFQGRLGQPALGRGDIKLMAALGLWVGIGGLPLFFISAGLAGVLTALLWRRLGRGRFFPFAPALVAGCCLTLIIQLKDQA
jgi:leader peptidase (prepilin peptidase)/N-methyltransferase